MKCVASTRLSSPGHLAQGFFLSFFFFLSVAISEDAAQPFDLITLGENPRVNLMTKCSPRHNRHAHPLIGGEKQPELLLRHKKLFVSWGIFLAGEKKKKRWEIKKTLARKEIAQRATDCI